MSEESEDYDENDRMFNPDCYDSDEKLFDSEGEDDTDWYDYDAVVNFWATNKKAFIIRELVANSVESLERIAPSSELKNAGDDKEWKKHLIRIVTDKNKKTLSIVDSGVGMTKEELKSYGSSSGRGLLMVADKVVIRTKHHEEGNYEYEMELSPEKEEEDEKKIVVATQEDEDLLHLGSRRGTKITLFLKQQDDEVEYLQERTTYEVLVDRYLSTIYRIVIVGIEDEVVKTERWLPFSHICYGTSHHISKPINYS